jgi:RND family efflux transporter MFP subunit
MTSFTERILHYASLLVITVVSIWVMWLMSARGAPPARTSQLDIRPLPLASQPRALVRMAPLSAGPCEVTVTFAGKIEPWETYSLAFEIAGRVENLGENDRGAPLDEGDRVEAGALLAQLDTRVLRARRSEATAQFEQAVSDLDRARRARSANPSALSEAEFQQQVTREATARAALEVATKNLDDATLRAPVAGTIARREFKPGESVGAHQVVLELVQDDRMRLVVHVPESHVRELEQRRREVSSVSAIPAGVYEVSSTLDERVFRAHVQLEGTDRFGNRWPALDGEVVRIGEVADPRTSLFPVEVQLSNNDRLLRAGMVATADLVVDQIEGYRLPAVSVIYRQDRAYVFYVEPQETQLEMLYWTLGPTTVYRARRVELPRWVDQGQQVVVPATDLQLPNVVTRGQHRLGDGQLIRFTAKEGP